MTVENDPLRCHDRLVPDVRWSSCRLCNKACPILCEIEDGRLVRVTGDRADARYSGCTCTKGRVAPELLYGPHRLLHSHKRERVACGRSRAAVATLSPPNAARGQIVIQCGCDEPGRAYNPAFLYPDDLRSIGVGEGDAVTIRAAHDAIPAIAGPARTRG
jgi:hypothetical protein